jgi:Fe2+ or Zn2+ uptake regulation protein
MLIIPELKDKILKEFVSVDRVSFEINIRDIAKEFNTDVSTIEVILDHFEDLGFLKQFKFLGGKILFTMKVPAYDFYSHGGFVGQEELLSKNIKKLLLEIESLKPSMPEKVNLLTSIAGNITTALNLFLS